MRMLQHGQGLRVVRDGDADRAVGVNVYSDLVAVSMAHRIGDQLAGECFGDVGLVDVSGAR
jgi:hypothetical protein